MEEMTRQEIAKLMGVSPARVSQYTFLPTPVRKVDRYFYYDKEKVLAAIAKQYAEPKRKVTEQCRKELESNLTLRFLAGWFDPEEKQKEYSALKYWAHTHKPITKRVRIKDGINMRGKDGPISASRKSL